MGNSPARFQDRRQYIEDLNTSGINFIGGYGYPEHEEFKPLCPIDKLVLAYGAGKDSQDLFKINQVSHAAESESNMQKTYKKIVQSLTKKKIRLIRKFTVVTDEKACITGQKYHKNEAIRQINWALAMMKILGDFKGAADELEEVKEMEKILEKRQKKRDDQQKADEKDPAKDEVEEAKKDEENKQDPDIPTLTDNEAVAVINERINELDKYKGWKQFPALCLKILADCPYIYESVKLDTLRWEFTSTEGHKYKDDMFFGCLAGMTGQLVRGAQAQKNSAKKTETICQYGLLGEEDFMGLIELVDYEMRNLQEKSAQRRKDKAAAQPPKPKPNQEVKSKSEVESNLHDADLDDDMEPNVGDGQKSEGVEIASSSWKKDADKKFKHQIMIPGVTIGCDSLPYAMKRLAELDEVQSKQPGGTKKVIYQIEDAHSYADGDLRFTHRLFVEVLTHEVIMIKKADMKKDDAKKDQAKDAKKKPKKKADEQETPEQKEARQIHLFRLKAVPRDYMLHITQWVALKKSNDEDRAGNGAAPSQSNKAKNTLAENESVNPQSQAGDNQGGCTVF